MLASDTIKIVSNVMVIIFVVLVMFVNRMFSFLPFLPNLLGRNPLWLEDRPWNGLKTAGVAFLPLFHLHIAPHGLWLPDGNTCVTAVTLASWSDDRA